MPPDQLKRLLAAIARRVPVRIVEMIGRRTGTTGPFSFVDRLARYAFSGHTVIQRGQAEGLRFAAAGERPGFSLGTWEPEVQRAFASVLAEGKVVYDIGAASGFYTLIAARRVAPHGAVVAFEPIPESAERLRRNVSLNEFANVTVLEVALSDRAGQGVMVEGHEQDQAALRAIDAENGVEVAVTTIDELVADGTVPPPDVLKLDVEGAEATVLRGAANTLRDRLPVLLVELHGTWPELKSVLEEHGYGFEGVESPHPHLATSSVHLIARPRESALSMGSGSVPPAGLGDGAT